MAYISAPEYCSEKFLYSTRSYGSNLSKNELCPIFLACFELEKLSKNCGVFFSGHPVQLLIHLSLAIFYIAQFVCHATELISKPQLAIEVLQCFALVYSLHVTLMECGCVCLYWLGIYQRDAFLATTSSSSSEDVTLSSNANEVSTGPTCQLGCVCVCISGLFL